MKQKRDVRLIVLGVILLFFLAGCDKGDDDSGGAPTTPFLGGTKGLEIGFVEDLPPEEVADGGTFEFQAMVSLKNSGEYEVGKENVRVDLIGILPADFSASTSDLKDRNPDDDLTPRQRDSEGNIIEPVETFVLFPGENENFNFIGSIAGNTLFIFRADVCYKYQTRAVSEICVLENMIDVADDAICEPSGEKSVFSSCSPVQVTAFRQNVVGRDRIQFSFDIEHSGSGKVFELSENADCPKESSARRTKEDRVEVTVDTGLGYGNLNCIGLSGSGDTQTGFVKLVNGKRTVTCTQTLNADRGDFKKSIDITLEFDYLDSVDKDVLVKHLLGYPEAPGPPGPGP
jgi:hypothetical protein